jgi:hypothetical protein
LSAIGHSRGQGYSTIVVYHCQQLLIRYANKKILFIDGCEMVWQGGDVQKNRLKIPTHAQKTEGAGFFVVYGSARRL